jgi:hypothetical protein
MGAGAGAVVNILGPGAVPMEAAHPGCRCRKSRCLKLYCACFAAQATCAAYCTCVSCFNLPEHSTLRQEAIRQLLERNPGAFLSKVQARGGKAATHRNGCKCRKSMCLKKYCEVGAGQCSAVFCVVAGEGGL